MINIKCPGCGRSYELADEAAGKQAKCKCGKSIHVPVPGVDDAGMDLAPLDDIDDPFAGPVSDGMMLQPSKGDAALKSALDPAGQIAELAKKKKKRVEASRKSPLMLVLIIGGTILAVLVVALLPLIAYRIATRPGFKTTEDAYAALRDSVVEQDWRAEYLVFAPESREALLTMMLRRALFEIQESPEVREVMEEYGVDDDSDRNRLFEANEALVTERTQSILGAVKKHAEFYSDLGRAIEAAEERKIFNSMLQTMHRKERKQTRRAIADSELAGVSESGDHATATLKAVIDDNTFETAIAFQRVDGRWYVQIPEGTTGRFLLGGSMSPAD